LDEQKSTESKERCEWEEKGRYRRFALYIGQQLPSIETAGEATFNTIHERPARFMTDSAHMYPCPERELRRAAPSNADA